MTPFSDMESLYCKSSQKIDNVFAKPHSELKEETRRQLSQISNNLQLTIFEAIRPVLSSYTSKYIQIIEQDNQHGSSVNSDACPYSS